MIKYRINPKYGHLKEEILAIPSRFMQEGEIVEAGRNTIKAIKISDYLFNIKSFKVPNFINRFAYAYIRESKAERSYNYARLLLSKNIGTPEPVAYIIYRNGFGITKSYYISIQQDCDLLFRDIKLTHPQDMEKILRGFTKFTWHFHQQGIYFIDHSPGNTLIKRKGEDYDFYLVDLNRIRFMKIDPLTGLKNFYRLNATDEMIEIMADEYARLTSTDPDEMTRLLKEWTHKHDENVIRRKIRKGRLPAHPKN